VNSTKANEVVNVDISKLSDVALSTSGVLVPYVPFMLYILETRFPVGDPTFFK